MSETVAFLAKASIESFYHALARKATVSEISSILLNKICKKVFGVLGRRPTNNLAVQEVNQLDPFTTCTGYTCSSLFDAWSVHAGFDR